MSRTDYLAEHFNGWLERYSPPRFMTDKPDAAQQEADALLRILGRHAPTQGYAEWLDGILRQLTENMTARTWPTGGEVSKACRDANKFTSPRDSGQKHETRDEAEIVAQAMSDGQPVGENWLYGVCACELAARGLVTRELMDRYRSAAFLSRRATYGDADALEWEAEAKARHDHGKALWRARDAARTDRNTARHMPHSTRPAA
jgi:hypothetical protein